jgi:hypothetical protein
MRRLALYTSAVAGPNELPAERDCPVAVVGSHWCQSLRAVRHRHAMLAYPIMNADGTATTTVHRMSR